MAEAAERAAAVDYKTPAGVVEVAEGAVEGVAAAAGVAEVDLEMPEVSLRRVELQSDHQEYIQGYLGAAVAAEAAD